MQITIIAVGKKPPSWIDAGVQEFSKRISGDLSLRLIEVTPVKRSKTGNTTRLLATEAARIRAVVPKDNLIIALDENGKSFTTKTLSTRLSGWMQDGQDVAIVIGGADGLDPELLQTAGETWSLSRLTLPHALVRVVLAEQIYRAWSILKNHPYHRD
jgi:23S rRNA (pseudouridine1915-N3)-methyltransferase